MDKKPSYRELRDALSVAISLVQLMRDNAITEAAISQRLDVVNTVLNRAYLAR